MFDLFKTLGDAFAPNNMPTFPDIPLHNIPEPALDVWQCDRCDCDCAGEKGIGLCVGCENAVRRSDSEGDARYKKQLAILDDIKADCAARKVKFEGCIETRLKEDRRKRDADMNKEYSYKND